MKRRRVKIHIKGISPKLKKKKTLREKWKGYSFKKKSFILITGATKIVSLIYAIYSYI